MTLADRVATRFRLVLAYTYAQALEVLGYKPGDTPDPNEVNQRYRKKIKDLMKENPGSLGDQQVMKPFNQAKDILLGQLEPDRSPGDFKRTPGGGVDIDDDFGGGAPPKKEPDTTVTFNEAKHDANIPTDVKWMFVTDRQRGSGDYGSDEFTRSTSGYVAVGETDSHWVFVRCQHFYYQAHVPGVRDGITDVWDMETFKYAKKTPVPVAAELYGHIKKVWKTFDYPMKEFNSKVVDARDWHFAERYPTGREITIKMFVSDLTGGEFTGKMKIEIAYKEARQEAPAGYYKPGQYSRPCTYELTINGKEYTLVESDVEKLYKLRISGKDFTHRVFGDYPEHSRAKNLTLNRDGAQIMAWMAANLAHLPDWVRAGLTKAADQKGKKASAYTYARGTV